MVLNCFRHGAEEVGAGTSSESHSNIPVFRGTAYRLGDSEDSSTVVPGFSTNSQPKQVTHQSNRYYVRRNVHLNIGGGEIKNNLRKPKP